MTLDEYARLLDGRPCRDCGARLPASSLRHYEHSGGWRVDGFTKREWLYAVCSSCGYQNALWKIGIVGSVDDEHNGTAMDIAEMNGWPTGEDRHQPTIH